MEVQLLLVYARGASVMRPNYKKRSLYAMCVVLSRDGFTFVLTFRCCTTLERWLNLNSWGLGTLWTNLHIINRFLVGSGRRRRGRSPSRGSLTPLKISIVLGLPAVRRGLIRDVLIFCGGADKFQWLLLTLQP